MEIHYIYCIDVHCKYTHPMYVRTAKKIRIMYSQKSNCEALFPISIFIHLWAIYIFPWSVHLFCCSHISRPMVGIYINRSQRYECKNWYWCRAVSFLGIFLSNFGTVSLQCLQEDKIVRFYAKNVSTFSKTYTKLLFIQISHRLISMISWT